MHAIKFLNLAFEIYFIAQNTLKLHKSNFPPHYIHVIIDHHNYVNIVKIRM